MLILVCFYVLMGLAVVAMSINLVQESIITKFREIARDMGIIEDEDLMYAEDNIMEGGGSAVG